MTCTEQSVGNGDVAAEAGAAKLMVAAAKAVAADRAKVNFFISTPSVTYRTKPRFHLLSCREDPIRNLNPLPYRQISSVRYSREFRTSTGVTPVTYGTHVACVSNAARIGLI